MRTQAIKFLAAALLAAVFLCHATTADARAIRIDAGDGAWNESESSSEISGLINLGFNFNLYGRTISGLVINPNGSVSAADGEVVIAPFIAGDTAADPFTYSILTGALPGLGSSVANAIRIQWGENISNTEAEGNAFQLTLFLLNSGESVMELNYGRIFDGSADSRIFFDNGLEPETNLLATLGLLPEFDPAFLNYRSIPDNYTENFDVCDEAGQILACNNYFNGVFGPDALNDLPAELAYFQLNPSSGQPAQGRYLFLTGESTVSVPEPGTLALLAIALGGAGVVRRRRR